MASLPQTQLQDGMPEVTSSRNHGAGAPLTAEQAEALAHVTDGRNPWIIIGHAGIGKIAMLDVA
jgi:hypothetical protein